MRYISQKVRYYHSFWIIQVPASITRLNRIQIKAFQLLKHASVIGCHSSGFISTLLYPIFTCFVIFFTVVINNFHEQLFCEIWLRSTLMSYILRGNGKLIHYARQHQRILRPEKKNQHHMEDYNSTKHCQGYGVVRDSELSKWPAMFFFCFYGVRSWLREMLTGCNDN